MTDTFKYIVVDDHDVVREGVKIRLETNPLVKVIGEACDGDDALEVIRKLKPDFALLDLDMEKLNGLQVIRQLAKEDLPTKVIIFSAFAQPSTVRAAMNAGAVGYILKKCPTVVFNQGIESICKGDVFVDPSLSSMLVGKHSADLTQRQMEILQLIANGKTSKEIAEELSLSSETIKTHVNHILEKLDATSRAHAVAIALDNDLIERT